MKHYLMVFGSMLVAASLGFGFSATDTPEGWASQSGGTSGGTGGAEVTVSGMSQLQSEAKSSGKKIIIIAKGTYTGNLSVTSNKTIIGKEPGAVSECRMQATSSFATSPCRETNAPRTMPAKAAPMR